MVSASSRREGRTEGVIQKFNHHPNLALCHAIRDAKPIGFAPDPRTSLAALASAAPYCTTGLIVFKQDGNRGVTWEKHSHCLGSLFWD